MNKHAKPEDFDIIDEGESDAPVFSDINLAERFAAEHCGRLRYVALWGKWMLFDGQRWAEDETLRAYDMARAIAKAAAASCNKPKDRRSLASAKTIAAVERIAKADRQLAATTEQWDTDPWLLNTPGGVVDLRTGEIRPNRPDDYMTKITEAAPAPDSECPIWKAHLLKIMNGDQELVDYLQIVFGYALTGSTREEALFFGYGSGKNGKSKTVDAITYVMGDYHQSTPAETLMVSNSERHPTEIARLRGARLVTATEVEEGQHWSEARIKKWTGGDRLEGRFMRQDYFEFEPQFKLFIHGNHQPRLRTVDEAIKRRLHLIPFSVTIPEAERDKMLEEKLHAEAAGILAWAIEGAVKWHEKGLERPKAVKDATDAYMSHEDTIEAFIDEMCVRDPQGAVHSSDLYGVYKIWIQDRGEALVSLTRFSPQIEVRGFKKDDRLSLNGKRAAGFKGLRIRGRGETDEPSKEASEAIRRMKEEEVF